MALPVGSMSYAAAGAAFLFLSALLVTSWRGRIPGILLATGSLATVLWCGAAAWLLAQPGVVPPVAQPLEIARGAIWLLFLLVLLGYSRKHSGALRRTTVAVLVCCGVFFCASLLAGGLGSHQPGALAILAHLAMAVTGLVLVEQLYRNVHPQQRWGMKFLCLGLGAIFACDFYLY